MANPLNKIVKGAVAAAALAGVAATTAGTSKVNQETTETNKGNRIQKGTSYRILNDTFDLSEINDYYLENKEFIFLPTYKEESYSGFLGMKKTEIKPTGDYVPYAGILKEDKKRIDLSNVQSFGFAETLAKEVIQKASDVVGDVVKDSSNNLNGILSNFKLIKCIDVNGKRFNVTVPELPYEIHKENGTKVVKTKYDLEKDGTEVLSPEIRSVSCLIVEADKNYYYFGEGLCVDSVDALFNDLHNVMTEALENVKKVEHSIPEQTDTSVEGRMKRVKTLYEQGVISEEDYKSKITELLKEI